MSRVHLVFLWHMHQPQYKDPTTGKYVMPWTRLHALKDYWGMVHLLREFPGIHATFNVVPSLAHQIEEYASGKFDEPWFSVAFKSADKLTEEDKREILQRAFQVNHEHLMSRWPRFIELFGWTQKSGADRAVKEFAPRDWRDLQVLSQLAWMDEDYLANDPVVSALAHQGSDYSEKNKQALLERQAALLSSVLPEYAQAAERGQIEISTTPFYHPILPLLCDSEIARIANPHSPPLAPPFRHSEDAREQLQRARLYHQYLFGRPPAGLWPSEGSVSDETLRLAADFGFQWFATDEGILGRTLNIAFWRDSEGYPQNPDKLYSPWKFRVGDKEISGVFRDHYLSDLIGFVYSRMGAAEAAADFHRRLRMIGDRAGEGSPPLFRSSSMARTPGNTIRATAANFSASFTRESRKIPKSARLRSRKPSPPRARFPCTKASSLAPGSTRISISGSAMRKTSAPGSCCATLATPTRERLPPRHRKPPHQIPISLEPTRLCSPRKAATGAGGSAPSTAPPTTQNSMSCIARTSLKFTPPSASKPPRLSPIL